MAITHTNNINIMSIFVSEFPENNVLIQKLIVQIINNKAIITPAIILNFTEFIYLLSSDFTPPLNLIRSIKLHLTTEPLISCRCCYAFV